MGVLPQWAEVPCANLPLSESPQIKRNLQGLVGLFIPWYPRLIPWAPKRWLLTVYYLCFWSLSLRDFRNQLWALGTQTLPLLAYVWWRFLFKGHQTFKGSTLLRASRLFFSPVICLFFQPRAALNFYCALLSLFAALSCLQKQWESGTWA